MPPFVPKSSVEGNCWPSLTDGRTRALLAIQAQLEQSQWWPEKALRAKQHQQLGLLVAHAYLTVPYYRQLFDRTGLKLKGRMSSLKWSKIPLLLRKDVQDAGATLHSSRLPASHGKVSEIFTSGTTGTPVHVLRTRLSMLFFDSFTLRYHIWQGFDPAKKLAAIRDSKKGKAPYPDGGESHWGVIAGTTPGAGKAVSLNLLCTTEQHVDWLQRHNPDYLITFPSTVREVAEYCIKNKIKLPKLSKIQSISEVITPRTRELCRQAWGVEMCDIYSSREIGYMALQCPEHEHYHVQSEGVLLEVLDEEGKACAPGEVGRVVVTPLHNFVMPMIRYDIGDYAEVGEPCSCGRGLPVLKRIFGREQGMLVLPSGEKRSTLLGSGDIEKFLAIAPIRQYQLVQTDVETIEVRLATERRITSEEEGHVKEWVKDKFGYPFAVGLTYHDEIAKDASGKYHDFISQVKT